MNLLKLHDMLYTCHLIKLYYKLYRNKLPTHSLPPSLPPSLPLSLPPSFHPSFRLSLSLLLSISHFLLSCPLSFLPSLSQSFHSCFRCSFPPYLFSPSTPFHSYSFLPPIPFSLRLSFLLYISIEYRPTYSRLAPILFSIHRFSICCIG